MVEAEIARLDDVIAVRTVLDGDQLDVHVLASPGRTDTEVIADVRSIAAVRLLEVPLRAVHVVMLDADPFVPGSVAPAELHASVERVELVDVVVLFDEQRPQTGRVASTLRRGAQSVTGAATCIAAAGSVRRAVAEATLTALVDLHDSGQELAVDSAIVTTSNTHELAVVVIEMVVPTGQTTLVGATLVRGQGVYDAIGRAVLDATNRRLGGA